MIGSSVKKIVFGFLFSLSTSVVVNADTEQNEPTTLIGKDAAALIAHSASEVIGTHSERIDWHTNDQFIPSYYGSKPSLPQWRADFIDAVQLKQFLVSSFHVASTHVRLILRTNDLGDGSMLWSCSFKIADHSPNDMLDVKCDQLEATVSPS